MNEALSEDERDECGDLEAWPGSLSELLEQHGIEERRLLYFYWDGFGPTSWVAGLVLIGNGKRRYPQLLERARVVPNRRRDRAVGRSDGAVRDGAAAARP